MIHFTFYELCRSTRYPHIDNHPTQYFVMDNLARLADYVLEPLRAAMGFPIVISSGYRSEPLNKAVGGATNSYHLLGRAVDIDCGAARNRQIYDWLVKRMKTYELKELLWERNGEGDKCWVHLAV